MNEISSNKDFDFEKNINNKKMIESETIKYVSLIKKLFYRIIFNDLHKMKFSKIKIDLTIFKLNIIVYFF